MKIELEKVDTYEGVSVKALLDSGVMGLFMSKKLVEREDFQLRKLEKPIKVRNIDRTGNSGESIIHEVECNMCFQEYVERVQMDVCELEKTEVILGMSQLAAHNTEIDWEKGEVYMTRYPLMWGERRVQITRKRLEVRKTEDKKKVEELVPKKFQKWKKVFEKVESEYMPTRKHAIELKERFSLRKKSIFAVKKREERSTSIHRRSATKRIHQAVKVSSDFISPFCG